jgi:hypothetical protein
VCMAHGNVDIFQGTGVEILFLDRRYDSDIGKINCVELLDEIRVFEDEVPAPVSN